MLNRKKENQSAVCVVTLPLEWQDRAFLRMLRDTAGGRMQLVTVAHKRNAEACEKSGYVRIEKGGRYSIVTVTSRGQVYLDRIRGAH